MPADLDKELGYAFTSVMLLLVTACALAGFGLGWFIHFVL